MKIAIIGTGTVGTTIASKLVELKHNVMLGTRNVEDKLASTKKDSYGNPPFSELVKTNKKVKLGSKDYGYLVCEDCLGYYKLEKGENPEDFESCRCGGTLKFTKKLR